MPATLEIYSFYVVVRTAIVAAAPALLCCNRNGLKWVNSDTSEDSKRNGLFEPCAGLYAAKGTSRVVFRKLSAQHQLDVCNSRKQAGLGGAYNTNARSRL